MSVPDRTAPFLRRVSIRNYKSIAKADVELGSFTILVGRNGAGKSNFLDALHFVSDGLQSSLDHAIKARGGASEITYRRAESRSFAITLEILLPERRIATYGFVVKAQSRGSFRVGTEFLDVHSESGSDVGHYLVERGEVSDSSIENPPPAQPDRLYLVSASGFPEFRVVYDALSSMSFYNLNPDSMKILQKPDAGELLHRDGSNLASVIARLSAEHPQAQERLTQYLSAIVPGLEGVEKVSLGPLETVQFKLKRGTADHPLQFFAWSMSDGTLRALGSLVATGQLAGGGSPVSLVGIEEPETALHPAAAGVLMDALREASSHTQILVTSHSPDLLDQVDLETDRLLAVLADEGVTKIAPIDKASLAAIQEHLYTPGELLRLDQLDPDPEDLARQERESLPLVEDWEE
ncbi:MAG TPA: AAA family ATPase [Thermoanaerobaculia bacterium]|nr:AAA family ATPase [Thermoanaerobaculia bacterium]